jgi:hypothetical protein
MVQPRAADRAFESPSSQPVGQLSRRARRQWRRADAWPEVGAVVGFVSFEPELVEVTLDGRRLAPEPGQQRGHLRLAQPQTCGQRRIPCWMASMMPGRNRATLMIASTEPTSTAR